jgi:hypothetical protein
LKKLELVHVTSGALHALISVRNQFADGDLPR